MAKAFDDRQLAALVAELCRLLGNGAAAPSRPRLQALLTGLGSHEVPAKAWPLLDSLFAAEAARRPVVRADDLPRLALRGWASHVSLWRGDITTLQVEAIVNAANSGLTGCYRPFHACVDNAIHTAAGPRLRQECELLMAARARPEPTGTATATRGWFLPARRVLHTVGPIVGPRGPGGEDAARLRSCYLACLAASELKGARSVAFCGISTGVFGYPTAAAAPLALSSVRQWLESSEAVEHVVLVTYSDADEAVYAAAAKEACRAQQPAAEFPRPEPGGA